MKPEIWNLFDYFVWSHFFYMSSCTLIAALLFVVFAVARPEVVERLSDARRKSLRDASLCGTNTSTPLGIDQVHACSLLPPLPHLLSISLAAFVLSLYFDSFRDKNIYRRLFLKWK